VALAAKVLADSRIQPTPRIHRLQARLPDLNPLRAILRQLQARAAAASVAVAPAEARWLPTDKLPGNLAVAGEQTTRQTPIRDFKT
jgi:hypothetical protein